MDHPEPAEALTLRLSPEAVALVLVLGMFLGILGLQLVPALLAGLLAYSLMHHVAAWAQRRKLSSGGHAKAWALGILGGAALLVTGLGLLGLSLLWKAQGTHLPDLLTRMAQVLATSRHAIGDRFIPEAFTDAETFRQACADLLEDHAEALKTAGSHAGRAAAHALAGFMVGLLAAFHRPNAQPAPLAAALALRLARLRKAFEAVVFAQVGISALNTLLTALFLYGLLPLFHVHLPLRPTLVAVTFVTGLLPVVGNLLSNAAIVLLSLGAGPGVALASLGYLVAVHKLEYLLNARLVGRRIQAQAWEVLLAMVLLEAAFGLPGLVLAPILLAYLREELTAQGWI